MEAQTQKLSKLIHLGRILDNKGNPNYLFLRQKAHDLFTWHQEANANNLEIETAISGSTIEEALRLARKHWQFDSFRTVLCGFRYNLPERDEHGNNALFHQMAASYASSNGVYFDEDLGHNCLVNFASREAQDIWNKLKQEGRL